MEPHHLLELQGRNMSGASAMRSNPSQPPLTTQTHRWRDVQCMAEHVQYIGINEPIYVVEDDSKKICSNRACPEQINRIKIITVEPLLDWGTVTATLDVFIDPGVEFSFRRNGPLMDNPLWTQLVKRSMPKELRAYCTDCLGELYKRRREAWEVIDELTYKHAHGRPLMPLMPPIQRPRSKAEMYDRRESTSPDTHGEGSCFVHSLLAVDGTSTATRSASGHTVEDSRNGFSVKAKEPLRPQNFSGTAQTLPNNDFTSAQPAVRYIDVSFRSSSFFPQTPPLSRQPPATASINHTVSTKNERDTHEEEYKKQGVGAIEGSELDFTSLKRGDGRGINTNAFCRFLESRTENRLAKRLAKMLPDTRDFGRSVNEAGPSTPKRKAGTSPGSGSLGLSSVPSNLSTQAVYSPIAFESKGKARAPAEPNPFPHSNFPSDLSYPNNPEKGDGKKVTFGLNTTPPPKPSTKPQPQFAPVFCRVNAATQGPPPGVSELEYLAFLTRVPAKDDIICICNKPAQTYDVRIAQCNTPDCPIGWLHYNCGDTTFKRSISHRTQICQICRNEKHFADLYSLGGSASQTTPPAPLTGEDIVAAAVPNMGGFTASRNPYGLAGGNSGAVNGKPLSPLAPSFIPGLGAAEASGSGLQPAVGSAMAMGLAPSRPALFTEAYTQGPQLALEADERWAHRLAISVGRAGYGYPDDEWDDEIDMYTDE
ncbi:hypothetical protein PTNB73_05395 [Pyrenophora teres f. teres]|nr:hypothetical protein HRS9139_05034 [Pyrenophora teres f. teres]KAE8841015.1 hypothetical protein PTNB85_04414 [Pyrenophora teres f. teres]KAE8848848.1 hypothetical protein HRS9122_02864 [Pyrenophora teres f. teres]KAE8864512.1 hypothetical protein PTNB29_04476 [Pyrenophora teres f. teres]KAE8867301.1 hypothetical protein PTNB73_05395 [Pyrenophora teres f. teres]